MTWSLGYAVCITVCIFVCCCKCWGRGATGPPGPPCPHALRGPDVENDLNTLAGALAQQTAVNANLLPALERLIGTEANQAKMRQKIHRISNNQE